MSDLFDASLERMLVKALICDPQDTIVTLPDLVDGQARKAFEAWANLRAAGEAVGPESVRARLADLPAAVSGHLANPDRGWFDEMMLIELPDDPPLAFWAHSIIDLAEARRTAVDDAEPPKPTPKQSPGPRASSVEPLRLAEAFRRYKYEQEGHATLVRWARAWWRWDGVRYVELDDEALDRDLIALLDVVRVPKRSAKDGSVSWERVTSKSKTISEVRKALLAAMPSVAADAPHWTEPSDADASVEHLICCQNGALSLLDRKLFPPTPRLFATTAVGAIWDPDAPEPRSWLAFLASIWGDDVESIQALQQIFGYLLTQDTSQQKILALIGPPRSGKGTIARVLKALLGDAVTNPTLASLEETFGLQPLIGKSLAILGDARLGNRGEEQQAVTERLLSLSGEDDLVINRKNRDQINVRLKTRVLMLMNELPKFNDQSGALAERFIILMMTRSFLGSEDIGLEAKLLAELPGILRWAIDGRDVLLARGRLLQPESGARAKALLKAASSPITQFVADCCELGDGLEVGVDELYKAYADWCEEGGFKAANKLWFGRDLFTIHSELSRERLGIGSRSYVYRGVSIRPNNTSTHTTANRLLSLVTSNEP